MQSQQGKKNITLSVYIKCVAILLFLFFTAFIVACSSNGSGAQQDPGTPVATVTINLGQFNSSPTPKLQDYYCGGWATDTTPPFNPSSTVSVYAKFTHNVGGNPEGVAGASATATILWPDGSIDTMTATTTSDGLAVFPVVMKPSALNKQVLIQITFSAPGATCTIPQAAYFTAIMVSPTPTNTAMPSPTNTGTPSVTPTGSPSPGTPTVTPSASPTKKPGP